MRNISSKIWKKVSDKEYINGLKRGDKDITEMFFYGLCNYMLNDIKFSLMQGSVEYDELVSELFIFLSKDNWHKLDTFSGINGCSLCSWVARITWRYFMKQRERLLGKAALDITEIQIDDIDNYLEEEIVEDVMSTFENMSNERYVQILQWMFVEGYEADEVAEKLNTTKSNVYNIKHRAIVQFVETFKSR